MGLNQFAKKNKYRPSNSRTLKVDDEEFERTTEFKYLGSTLTEENNITIKIKQRILLANRASYGLKKQLSSR
jgi:alpha-D-ribose 1-methylphosphonate 5-triphosphate synthase subunit PhnH